MLYSEYPEYPEHIVNTDLTFHCIQRSVQALLVPKRSTQALLRRYQGAIGPSPATAAAGVLELRCGDAGADRNSWPAAAAAGGLVAAMQMLTSGSPVLARSSLSLSKLPKPFHTVLPSFVLVHFPSSLSS
jgi:hypothetical protein